MSLQWSGHLAWMPYIIWYNSSLFNHYFRLMVTFKPLYQITKTCPRHIKRAALNTFQITKSPKCLKGPHYLTWLSYIFFSWIIRPRVCFLCVCRESSVFFFHWPTDKKVWEKTEQAPFLKHTQVSLSLTWYFPQRKNAVVCARSCLDLPSVVLCVCVCVCVCATDKATDVSVQSYWRASESFLPCHIKWLKGNNLFLLTVVWHNF